MELAAYIRSAADKYRRSVDLSDPTCMRLAIRQLMSDLRREFGVRVSYCQIKNFMLN